MTKDQAALKLLFAMRHEKTFVGAASNSRSFQRAVRSRKIAEQAARDLGVTQSDVDSAARGINQ